MPRYPYHYELSLRQRKELLERGRQLQIALPLPSDLDQDMTGHKLHDAVRELLPTLEDEIGDVEICEISVLPIERSGGSLAELLGKIADDPLDRRPWTVRTLVIVVQLDPDNARQSPAPVQWPGAVIFDGRRYPKPA